MIAAIHRHLPPFPQNVFSRHGNSQLMQLEEELGVKLFRRSQHHIVLTEAGMLLRRRAQEIVELAEKTARELRPAEEVTGRISIGSGDLRSMTYLAKLLAAFHRQHPRVQYEIYSGDSDGIKERIEQGLLDMGLLLEPVDTSRYQILRLPVRESWGGTLVFQGLRVFPFSGCLPNVYQGNFFTRKQPVFLNLIQFYTRFLRCKGRYTGLNA